MTYIQQMAQNFALQLTKPRRYNYSQQLLSAFFQANVQIKALYLKIKNKQLQKLDTLLVQNSLKSKTCIIYCHGLGSNKLQVLPILKFFKDTQYNICSFDFSGSGKSEGNGTFYGIKEQNDINTIIEWLDKNKNYERYILWGRSMGSVAAILSQQLCLFSNKIQCMILDSPFSSFQKISIQLAAKKSYIPQFLLGLLIQPLKQYFSSKCEFNPFKMNIIEAIKRVSCKTLFIYSKNDSVVNYSHSTLLKLNCSKISSQIQIKEDHNMQRSKATHKQVADFIQKQIKYNDDKNIRKTRQKSRGISLTFKYSCAQSQKSQQKNKFDLSLMSIEKNKQKKSVSKPFSLATMKSFNRSTFLITSCQQNKQNSILNNTHNFSMTLNTKRQSQNNVSNELDWKQKSQCGKNLNNKENWTCLINSICLQKRLGQKFCRKKEKQNAQNIQGKQNLKINKINRPSIQLMRKNRFAF